MRLEPLTIEHAPALAEAAAGDRSTFGLTIVPEGLDATRRHVEGLLAEQAAGARLPFATVLAASGRVVGATTFLDLQYWAVDERPPGAPVVAEIGRPGSCPPPSGRPSTPRPSS